MQGLYLLECPSEWHRRLRKNNLFRKRMIAVSIGQEVPAVIFGPLHQLSFYWIVVQIDKGSPHFLVIVLGGTAEGMLKELPLSPQKQILFPGKARLALLLEARQIAPAVFNNSLMQMVRHKHQLKHPHIIFNGGNAVDGEIQQITAHRIEDEPPVNRALVAVINHPSDYFSFFHGCKDGKGKQGYQINDVQLNVGIRL